MSFFYNDNTKFFGKQTNYFFQVLVSEQNLVNIERELRFRVFKLTGLALPRQNMTNFKSLAGEFFMTRMENYFGTFDESNPHELKEAISKMNEDFFDVKVPVAASRVASQINYLIEENEINVKNFNTVMGAGVNTRRDKTTLIIS